jgi:hypothetical protein
MRDIVECRQIGKDRLLVARTAFSQHALGLGGPSHFRAAFTVGIKSGTGKEWEDRR